MIATLHQLLWERWGTTEHPAEWDGHEGGGKGSQRFWEYLWALDHIGYAQSVLDIGGGETLFFFNLLSAAIPDVSIVDPLVKEGLNRYPMTLEQFASSKVVRRYDQVTCISVLEHIEDKERFCHLLDTFDSPIVLTFELGEGCVPMPEMYRCLAQFKHHHVTKMESCPVVADNSAFDKWRPLGVVLEPNK